MHSTENQYAYMLEGFDKGWNYVGSQHSTTYTNLPAGTYTFRVKASNNDNIWNEEGTSIRIIVHPPFYLSLPFKIGYVLLFLLALGLCYATSYGAVRRNMPKPLTS